MSTSPDPDDDLAIVEARLPASIAMGIVAILYLTLPSAVAPGLTFIAPLLILLVLVPLTLVAPTRHERESPRVRQIALALLGLVVVFNVVALGRVLYALFTGNALGGIPLLRAAGTIWVTNMIMFGLAYWEVDAGGPHRRAAGGFVPTDWLFPQQSDMRDLLPNWRPVFTDYAFVSLMTSTAFSPTDAMPISGRAKMLMGAEAIISLVTVVLVTARAVNILS